MNDASGQLKLALLTRTLMDREAIHRLQRQGLEVVAQNTIGQPVPAELNQADVLLVELGVHVERDYLGAVLDQVSVPVLLHEGKLDQHRRWDNGLIERLQYLADCPQPYDRRDARASQPAPLVVVLCASVGGPRAVCGFFEHLPAGLPVVFLLVQHMADEFQDMLGAQLSRFTDAPVSVLDSEHSLRAGDVWIVPADARIEVNRQRIARRLDGTWDTVNRPSMDGVLEMVASACGPDCGAIMFSGVGYDGISGCDAIVEQGGFVWAQSAESSVMSRLPDSVRSSGHVELSGSPEELATALYRRCLNHYQASC